MSNLLKELKYLSNDTMNNRKFFEIIFMTFIYISYIIILITTYFNISDKSEGSYGKASILLWCYSIIFISVFFKCFLNNNSLEISEQTIFIGILVFLIFWVISINLNFFKEINMNKMPNSYNNYSFITNILLLLLTSILVNVFGFDKPINYYTITVGIIIVFTFFSLLIQQLMLDNYYVDVL